jgi:hypothetical protein
MSLSEHSDINEDENMEVCDSNEKISDTLSDENSYMDENACTIVITSNIPIEEVRIILKQKEIEFLNIELKDFLSNTPKIVISCADLLEADKLLAIKSLTPIRLKEMIKIKENLSIKISNLPENCTVLMVQALLENFKITNKIILTKKERPYALVFANNLEEANKMTKKGIIFLSGCAVSMTTIDVKPVTKILSGLPPNTTEVSLFYVLANKKYSPIGWTIPKNKNDNNRNIALIRFKNNEDARLMSESNIKIKDKQLFWTKACPVHLCGQIDGHSLDCPHFKKSYSKMNTIIQNTYKNLKIGKNKEAGV